MIDKELLNNIYRQVMGIYATSLPNLTEEDIKKRIEVFLMFLSLSKLYKNEDLVLTKDFKNIFDDVMNIFKDINNLQTVSFSNIIKGEILLKFLYYVIDSEKFNKQCIYNATLGGLYKKLDILQTNDNKEKQNYYDILMRKNDYNEYYSPDDKEYAENYFADKKNILPFVKAYCGRNAIVHGNLPKENQENYCWERFVCMFYTVIEVVYCYNNIIVNKYIDECTTINEYVLDLIKKYKEKYSTNFSYIPLSMHIYENDYYKFLCDYYNEESNFLDVNKDIDSGKIKFNNKPFNKVKIIGYAGIGKTTTLDKIIYDEACLLQKNHYKGNIPVLIELIEINDDKKDIIDIIVEKLNNFNRTVVEKLIQKGKINLYIDGVNELRINDLYKKREYLNKLEAFILNCPNMKIIITDRDNNENSILNDYPSIIIDGVKEQRIKDFVYGNSSKGEYVYERLEEAIKNNPTLTDTLKNAFMLKNIITITECNKKIPSNEDEIAESFLKAIVERETVIKRDYRAKHILRLLIYIVAEYTKNNEDFTGNIFISYFDIINICNDFKNKYVPVNGFDSNEIIELIVKLGILKVVDTEKYTFVDDRYFNYFYYTAVDHNLI